MDYSQQEERPSFSEELQAPRVSNTKRISLNSPVAQASRQRLKEPINKKCREFFSSFHRESFEYLKPCLTNETWTPLQLPPTFKIIRLKELKFLASQSTTESIMDSDKVFSLFESGEELFHVQLTHHAEHDNFGEDSLPFLLKEDEELLGILSQEQVEAKNDSFEFPTLTNASMNVIRYVGRYGRVVRSLPPVQNDAFNALLELFEFYLYSLFTSFGLYTYSFYGRNQSQVPFRYPHLHKMVNLIRWKVQQGKFGAGVFEKEPEPEAETLINIVSSAAPPGGTAAPPPLVRFDDGVMQKLNLESSMFGIVERTCAIQSLKFLARIYRWSVFQLSPHLKREKKIQLDKFANTCSLVAEEFSVYLMRNLATKLVPIRRITDDLIPNNNWKLSELGTSTSMYVDEFVKQFKLFDFRLKTSLAHQTSTSMVKLIWRETIIFAFECLVDGYALVKKCNNEGRALMSLDLRSLVSALEAFVPLKPLPHVDYVDAFIKAYYLSEAELLKWAGEHPVCSLFLNVRPKFDFF
jgi:hypothetical protein